VLLEKPTVIKSRNSLPFRETECLCSQEPTRDPYPEPDASIPHRPKLHICDPSYYYSVIYA